MGKIKGSNNILKFLATTFLLFVIVHLGFTNRDAFYTNSSPVYEESYAGQNSFLNVTAEDNELPPPPEVAEEPETTEEPVPEPVTAPKKTTPAPVPAPAPEPDPPPLTGSCPVSTQSCVPCNEGELYCRTKMGETSGYLGWACQNNNPGNILAPTASVKAFKDGIIVNNGGTASCGTVLGSNNYTYMVFSTYEIGINSLKAYIKGINNGEHYAYVNTQTSCAGPETFTCGNCTLQQFFCKFAGTSTYATSIANKMGGTVTTNTLLSWVVDNRLDDMVNAIKQTEGFFTN